MNPPSFPWTAFAIALGIGLLVGAERERSEGNDEGRAVAGIRTFAVVALLGAASATLAPLLIAVALAAVALLIAIAYARDIARDPGLTTESSLLLCLLLGALATRTPALAAGLAVALTALLASRDAIHHFVRGVLTEAELNNLLVLAAATLIVLPLLPDRQLGPFDAINPHALWLIVILIMSIGALAHTLLRLVGDRIGLPLVGLLSGFVSSLATVGAMGARARRQPVQATPAVAAAVLSTVATFVQMAAVLAVIDVPTLRQLSVPLVCGGVAAALYGGLSTWRNLRAAVAGTVEEGSAFSVLSSLLLGLAIAVVLVVSAGMRRWLGDAGLLAVAGIAGLADTHSPAASVATLVAAGKLAPTAAVLPILAALTANTLSKAVMAAVSGGAGYARPVVLGLALVMGATWAGWWLA